MSEFSDWIDAANKRADDLYRIEQQTADAVAKPIEKELADVMQGLAKRYITEVGSVYERNPDPAKVALVTTWLVHELRLINFGHIDAALKTGIAKAWKHGLKSLSAKSLPRSARNLRRPRISKELREVVTEAKYEAAQRIVKAIELVESAERWGDLTTAMAKARQSANSARGIANYVTNRTSNEAVQAVSAKAAEWIPVVFTEIDACVHCQAYAGVTTDDDGKLPGKLTYGEKPVHIEPFAGPPIHRHCRCHLELVHKTDLEMITEVLKREAERSIARGEALESESKKTRLKAVSKLLKSKDLRIPKTVVERGRRAVEAGTFNGR